MNFKRNQIEEALRRSWPRPAELAPAALSVRLKRLLETDRKLGRSRKSDRPEVRTYAFYSDDPPGSGVEVLFSPYEAYALRLGLLLLNNGLPQATVVRFLRQNRDLIEPEHQRILQMDPATFREKEPLPGGLGGALEQSVYLILAPRQAPLRHSPDPVQKEPLRRARICRNEGEMSQFIRGELGFEHVAITIDLVRSAFAMTGALKETKPSRRGKK